jgi:hypothetical protein
MMVMDSKLHSKIISSILALALVAGIPAVLINVQGQGLGEGTTDTGMLEGTTNTTGLTQGTSGTESSDDDKEDDDKEDDDKEDDDKEDDE